MLARRLVPCLDVNGGRVVKGVRFVELRDAGDPVECAARYDAEGADELVLLDITASSDARPILIDLVRRVADAVYLPFTVGGGVRSVEDADALLRAGADKVSVNTAAVRDPELLTRLAARFGSQAIVLAIDARRAHVRPQQPQQASAVGGSGGAQPPRLNDGSNMLAEARASQRLSTPAVSRHTATAGDATSDGGEPAPRFEVFVHGGRTPTGLDAVAWAREGVARGAGEILLTSMDRDGTGDGFDLELTRAVTSAVRVPVVASGGCGSVEHMAEVFTQARASAALAASIFHFGQVRIPAAKARLRAAGVEVRA
jgi:cyclase